MWRDIQLGALAGGGLAMTIGILGSLYPLAVAGGLVFAFALVLA